MELVLKSDWLYVMDNVLTPEECKKVIEIGEKYMEKSTTMGEYKEGYRTSSNAYVSNRYDDPIIQKINLVTEVLTELPQDNQEELCIVRYDQGQEYKVHHDFLDTTFDNDEETKNELARGGDREITVMFCLNDDMEEGGTLFTNPNIEIRPKTGRCVIWKNYLNGKPNWNSEHAGLPVKNGLKYIAVKWVRKNEFL